MGRRLPPIKGGPRTRVCIDTPTKGRILYACKEHGPGVSRVNVMSDAPSPRGPEVTWAASLKPWSLMLKIGEVQNRRD